MSQHLELKPNSTEHHRLVPDPGTPQGIPRGTPRGAPGIATARHRIRPQSTPRAPTERGLWRTLVIATQDYARRNGFRTAVVALSGGIDSSVVTVLAADALGADNVLAVSMPSDCSTPHSRQDAAELCARTGVALRTIPIQPLVDALHSLLPLDDERGRSRENAQARMRAVVLMAVSNQEDRLVLNTTNRTEFALGHTTLYGDSVGGFAPLKDVPKTLVWQLARWRNTHTVPAPVPPQILTKEPSPELAPGQLDSQLLPAPYNVLDAIIEGYVDRGLSRRRLLTAGFAPPVVDRVLNMIDRAAFKRRQSPPGPRLRSTGFAR
ncbi:NAD(+) synthase [Streptomyces sp. GC420]|uniref:NAD(+) synthase n=1 Tax=Streptomyces sp. GC420 TaxID=2697568 RepID=UPI0014152AD2|nr:NAD(+) synthase [Streptomyces sp. GC420]NBM19861.1 NAD(+) synthase [Streptomyces sp. GC420]